MRRIISLTALAIAMSGGVALANPGRSSSSGVRDHRGGYSQGGGSWNGGRSSSGHTVNPGYRHSGDGTYGSGTRSPIYVQRDNRFYFSGGVTRSYQRPVMRQRYFNYAARPAVIFESYQPMAGYDWSPGQWQWDGSEWIWLPGHYETAATHAGYSTYGLGGYPGYGR